MILVKPVILLKLVVWLNLVNIVILVNLVIPVNMVILVKLVNLANLVILVSGDSGILMNLVIQTKQTDMKGTRQNLIQAPRASGPPW